MYVNVIHTNNNKQWDKYRHLYVCYDNWYREKL